MTVTEKSSKKSEVIDLPLSERAASFTPSSVDEESRSIDVVWSTGARVLRRRFFGDSFYEELDMNKVKLDRFNAGAPLLTDHWPSIENVIGSVEPGSARIEGGKGVATVRFASTDEAESVWQRVREGHISAVSIGYRVDKYEITKNEKTPDIWRAVDWTPMELSAVPIGADPDARFRSSDKTFPCVIVRDDAPTAEGSDRTMARNTSKPKETVTDEADAVETQAEVRQKDDGEEDKTTFAKTEQSKPDTEKREVDSDRMSAQIEISQKAATAEERKRCKEINKLSERFSMGTEFASRMIDSGASVQSAKDAILDKLAAEDNDIGRTDSNVAIPLGGQDEKVTRHDAVVSALMHRANSANELSDAGRQWRGMTLLETTREILRENGESVRGVPPMELVKRAFHGTDDFPKILAAVTNKSLRAGYDLHMSGFKQFCRQRSANDFKTIHRVQLGEAPQLEKVNQHGEFNRGTITEGEETYAVSTYGKIFGITRQTIINDDLDAFTNIPGMMGQQVSNLEADIIWAFFTASHTMGDGNALFDASNHDNYVTSSGTILSITNLGVARQMMAVQKGLDGATYLNLRPAFLIVPEALGTLADQIVNAVYYPAETAKIATPFMRSLTVITEPRLDANSVTAWYMAANPAQVDTIEYAYLTGQEGPYTETRMGFDVDGMEVKIRHDFGAKPIDWRGLFKNDGASS